jgi:hypothetical protein
VEPEGLRGGVAGIEADAAGEDEAGAREEGAEPA